MDKKELTDEEIVKALEICAKDGWCRECPYKLKNIDCGIGQRSENDYLDLIKRQKAEIERLTEENCTLRTEIGNERRYYENAYSKACQLENDKFELQKQVDELKSAYKDLIETCRNCDTTKAVKDTAKEIYGEIHDNDILVVETQEYGEIEVVPIERLKEIFERKGVEVK